MQRAAAVLAALLVGHAPVSAQSTASEHRGWIGVNVEISRGENVPGGFRVEVQEVLEDGPAHLAGVSPGDRILGIDGVPLTPRLWESFTQSIRPGVRIRLTVERQGGSLDVPVVPDRRPTSPDGPSAAVAARIDSLRNQLAARVDSVLVTYLSARGDYTTRVRVSIPRSHRSGEADVEFRWSSDQGLPPVFRTRSPQGPTAGTLAELIDMTRPARSGPFGHFLAHSASGDSLRQRVEELRAQLGDLEQASRYVERAANHQANVATAELLSRYRRVADSITRHLDEAQGELNRSSLRVLRDRERPGIDPMDRADLERLPRRTVQVRSLSPYILLNTYALGGARLVPLNENLAQYFEVGSGVLVSEVADGSPAAGAQFLPGDVIVGVEGTAVLTLEDLFRELERRPVDSLTIRVVRKGGTVEVRYPPR